MTYGYREAREPKLGEGVGELQPDDGSAKLKSFSESTNQCASFCTSGSTRYSFEFPSLVFPIN